MERTPLTEETLPSALEQSERFSNSLTLIVEESDLSTSLLREESEFVVLGGPQEEEAPPCFEIPQKLQLSEVKREEAESEPCDKEESSPLPMDPECLSEQVREFLKTTLPHALLEGSEAVQVVLQRLSASLEAAGPLVSQAAFRASESLQEGTSSLSIPPQVEQVALSVKDTLEDAFNQTSLVLTNLFAQVMPQAPSSNHKAVFEESSITLEATFVRDVGVLDGCEMEPNTTFTKSWELKNSGSVAWPEGTALQYVGGSELFSCLSSGIVIGSVEPHSSVVVSLPLVAPTEAGRHTAFFRLVCPFTQVPFGDRLWCTVAVLGKPVFVHAASLSLLLEMGFPQEPSRLALEANDGNLEAAIAALLQ